MIEPLNSLRTVFYFILVFAGLATHMTCFKTLQIELMATRRCMETECSEIWMDNRITQKWHWRDEDSRDTQVELTLEILLQPSPASKDQENMQPLTHEHYWMTTTFLLHDYRILGFVRTTMDWWVRTTLVLALWFCAVWITLPEHRDSIWQLGSLNPLLVPGIITLSLTWCSGEITCYVHTFSTLL